jgi:hypothetical protein
MWYNKEAKFVSVCIYLCYRDASFLGGGHFGVAWAAQALVPSTQHSIVLK